MVSAEDNPEQISLLKNTLGVKMLLTYKKNDDIGKIIDETFLLNYKAIYVIDGYYKNIEKLVRECKKHYFVALISSLDTVLLSLMLPNCKNLKTYSVANVVMAINPKEKDMISLALQQEIMNLTTDSSMVNSFVANQSLLQNKYVIQNTAKVISLLNEKMKEKITEISRNPTNYLKCLSTHTKYVLLLKHFIGKKINYHIHKTICILLLTMLIVFLTIG